MNKYILVIEHVRPRHGDTAEQHRFSPLAPHSDPTSLARLCCLYHLLVSSPAMVVRAECKLDWLRDLSRGLVALETHFWVSLGDLEVYVCSLPILCLCFLPLLLDHRELSTSVPPHPSTVMCLLRAS